MKVGIFSVETKRESRNGLRPVTVKEINKEPVTGYFHTFGQYGNTSDGMDLYAIIELENGKITQVDVTDIKFDDVE